MTKADVQRWLDAYIAAWSSYDPAEIAALFTDDAAYHYDPFSEPRPSYSTRPRNAWARTLP